ncbi:diguanylate cyclase [Fictibacillus iocasae]|uniref:Diguanylate cyclase n=1 Tax=Fictibacillus iocasae TaxID=2715437 RepID=A0ABW2NNP0_9BACL
MEKKMQVYLIAGWLVLYPLAIYIAYQSSGPLNGSRLIDIFILGTLAVIVSMFPIKVLDSNISLSHGISLAAFLYFGMYVSFFITQLSVIALFLILKKSLIKEYYRYLAMTLMFAWITVGSGFVYQFLGGTSVDYDLKDPFPLVPTIGYILTYFVLNHILLYLISIYLYKAKMAFIDRDMWWDIASEIVVLPVGILLYILYSEWNRPAIFYVGFPFISLSIIINLYHSSQQVNVLLQKSSEIGQQLTEHLKVNDILDVFIEKMITIMKADYVFIFDTESGEYFKTIRKYEKEEGLIPFIRLKRNEGVSGRVWSTGRSVRFNTKKQWAEISARYFQGRAQSIMSVPMIRNQQIVGIITFASKEKWAYQKHHLMIIEILANYLAVAIDNARNYESTKLKSEQCPLTGLYNYRYFENVLSDMFQQYDYLKRQFSIILLDIDYFKRVNDTYGHQSGNEVLCQLSEKLERTIGSKGTVARYGGEEFVILLPETGSSECFDIAEKLRYAISNQPFRINNDLTDNKETSLFITASIGIATAPDQGEDALTLIRNADRAMYTGAKQQGRNKVACYIG